MAVVGAALASEALAGAAKCADDPMLKQAAGLARRIMSSGDMSVDTDFGALGIDRCFGKSEG